MMTFLTVSGDTCSFSAICAVARFCATTTYQTHARTRLKPHV
jgi:hypothetical protein